MRQLFEAARRVSVPIVVVSSADQLATVKAIGELVDGDKHPLLQWDAATGLNGVNKPGKAARTNLKVPQDDTVDFASAMEVIAGLPQGSVVCVLNAHRQLAGTSSDTAVAVQAVANLRDVFKVNFRMVVLLSPGLTLPPELMHDVIMLRDPLPTPEVLGKVIADLYLGLDKPVPAAPELGKSVEAVRGLSQFACEQQAAMSFTADGVIDNDALWERKRVTIEQVPGMTVYRGKERFKDIVGLDSVKARLRSRIDGQVPLGVIVVLDEFDKSFGNDMSQEHDVKRDQMKTFLTEMENNEWGGIVAVGVAGGGKTLLGKALGNEAGIPTIMLDFGGMEGPYVGESQQMLRQAIEVIKAVGGGHAYFLATSNGASVMRPEVQRRFTDGLFFFDLMGPEEQAATFAYFMKKYALKAQPLPEHSGWTGAEIRNCCRDAWNTKTSLVEAARFILPMATSRATDIEALRKYANGRFLDAGKAGPYRYDPEPMQKQVRAIELPPMVALSMAASISGKES